MKIISRLKRLCIFHKIDIIKTEMSTPTGMKDIYTLKCKKCKKVKRVIVLDSDKPLILDNKLKQLLCNHDIIIEFRDMENNKEIKVLHICTKCKKVLKTQMLLE